MICQYLTLNFEKGHRKRKEGATGRAINDGDIVDEPVDVLAVVVVLHKVTPANSTNCKPGTPKSLGSCHMPKLFCCRFLLPIFKVLIAGLTCFLEIISSGNYFPIVFFLRHSLVSSFLFSFKNLFSGNHFFLIFL